MGKRKKEHTPKAFESTGTSKDSFLMRLQEAAAEADTKKTVTLSGQREENAVVKKHLLEMLQRAENLPVYPDSAIVAEWETICKRLLPEWENKLLEVQTLAAAYKEAADGLLQMQETIKEVRAELNRLAGNAQCGTYFTIGRNAEGLMVERSYPAMISSIFAPICGQAI